MLQRILAGLPFSTTPDQASSSTLTLTQRHDVHLLRKIWHMSIGVVGLWAYVRGELDQSLTAQGIMLFSLGLIALELWRFKNPAVNQFAQALLAPIMRESEKTGPSGMPFYAMGISLSLFLYEEKIALLSILFLVFADPISSYFGILYGKDKIWGRKSLQGSLAGFVTCYLLTLVFGLYHAGSGINLLGMAFFAGLLGAAVELMSIKVDDNLTIPVLSGLGLSFLNIFFKVF